MRYAKKARSGRRHPTSSAALLNPRRQNPLRRESHSEKRTSVMCLTTPGPGLGGCHLAPVASPELPAAPEPLRAHPLHQWMRRGATPLCRRGPRGFQRRSTAQPPRHATLALSSHRWRASSAARLRGGHQGVGLLLRAGVTRVDVLGFGRLGHDGAPRAHLQSVVISGNQW